MNRLSFLTIIWLSALLLMPVVSSAGAQEDLENAYRLKAAFLYNFIRFTKWPEQTKYPDDKFQVCVATPMSAMETFSSLSGKTAHKRAIAVSAISPDEDTSHCHAIFYAKEANIALADHLSNPILTVGESETILARGGMIQLVEIEQKVRFKINIRTAEQSGLAISSKLLSLALEVQR